MIEYPIKSLRKNMQKMKADFESELRKSKDQRIFYIMKNFKFLFNKAHLYIYPYFTTQ